MINRCIEKETPPTGPDPNADPGPNPVPPPSFLSAEESLLEYAPEEADKGASLFFKGVSLSHLGRLGEALSCFLEAAESTWAVKAATAPRVLTRTSFRSEEAKRDSGRERNRMICYFAIAKVHQRERKHVLAVEYFTKAFDTLPHDKDVAFVLFRRAWSYKVTELSMSSSLVTCDAWIIVPKTIATFDYSVLDQFSFPILL
jgi:tetratricopeptide (TPR) repeat protein